MLENQKEKRCRLIGSLHNYTTDIIYSLHISMFVFVVYSVKREASPVFNSESLRKQLAAGVATRKKYLILNSRPKYLLE